MAPEQVLPGLWRIPLGGVNAYLIADDELTLVDTGVPKRAAKIAQAIRSTGRKPEEVGHIAITHYHVDHTGSLAAVARATDATVYVHPNDADVVREGTPPPMPSVEGPARAVMPIIRLFFPKEAEAAPVHHELKDGEDLPIAGGLRVVHTPGHTPGHVAFVWEKHGGVLIAGDAAWNLLGRLSGPRSYEDLAVARQSLRRISELEFDSAVFGHGAPLKGRAAARFRGLVERKGA